MSEGDLVAKDLIAVANLRLVVSIAKKYTIYSKVKGGDWNKIVFDSKTLNK